MIRKCFSASAVIQHCLSLYYYVFSISVINFFTCEIHSFSYPISLGPKLKPPLSLLVCSFCHSFWYRCWRENASTFSKFSAAWYPLKASWALKPELFYSLVVCRRRIRVSICPFTSLKESLWGLCLLRPSLFSERHFLSRSFTTSVILLPPRPVLAQSNLCIWRIIKIDLGYRRLNQSPDAPIKAGYTSKDVDLVEQLSSLRFFIYGRVIRVQMSEVAANVLANKIKSLRASWEKVVLAIKSTPFRKMVR